MVGNHSVTHTNLTILSFYAYTNTGILIATVANITLLKRLTKILYWAFKYQVYREFN